MFNDFVEARVGEAGRRSWAIAVSMIVQSAVLMLLIVMPLLYTDALPKAWVNLKSLVAPAVPLVEAPKPPRISPARSASSTPIHRFIDHGVIYQPRSFPPRPLFIDEPPLTAEVASDAGDPRDGVSLLSLLSEKPVEVPQPIVAPETQRIQKSQIEPAMILEQAQPAYPPLARMARIQGKVTLHAIIDKEGRVAELQVISGHPLLVEAALAAVRNWRYRPTLLGGRPVEVETSITVNFVLGG